jgi:chromodomain-helicase-DNA-binding protein 4
MQLRKCLCHPFVYSTEIEERNVSQAVSHRNLVDASGKLQLLETLLPKLQERGHRVLIFSQFLDMLTMVEDFLDGMQMKCQRLDGTISSLEKQKRIDEFNAPDSQLFAFLLSTRAGGVGINLATADTVIILDPDFNPHQDIQALSRAHRIGQKKKVLCFQMVTRASAEEKIMSYGRRKMALDHVLIEQMDAEDATDRDLEGILRHGTKELFDDDGDKDINYDAASIDRLLEVSHIEHTKAGEDKSAESTFSFARVWANNELEETAIEGPEATEVAPDRDVWDKILKERERIAAVEAAEAEQTFGRGRRAKAVSYPISTLIKYLLTYSRLSTMVMAPLKTPPMLSKDPKLSMRAPLSVSPSGHSWTKTTIQTSKPTAMRRASQQKKKSRMLLMRRNCRFPINQSQHQS